MTTCFHCHRTAAPGYGLCQAHLKSAQTPPAQHKAAPMTDLTPSTAAVPLPEPVNFHSAIYVGPSLGYTADQMRTYADACAQQARRDDLEAVEAQSVEPSRFMSEAEVNAYNAAVLDCAAAIRGDGK